MRKSRRLWIAVFIVAILFMMCSETVFAASSDGSSQSALGEEAEIAFFDGLETDTALRDALFLTGSILAFAGASGFLCMFLWSHAHKHRDRTQETREGILDEIEQAEQRNRKQMVREQKAEPAIQPVSAVDSFDTQENDIVVSASSEIVKEAPIVPSTPVSMQPGERLRPRVQSGNPQQSVQPIVVRPVQPLVKPVQTAAPVPEKELDTEPVKNEKPAKYDLDEILREIREGKL